LQLADNQISISLLGRFYWKASLARPACDAECKKRLLCDLKSGRSNDRKRTCQELEERIDGKKSSSWKTWLFNGFGLSSLFTFLGGYGWLGSSIGSWFTTPSLYF
jgi:sphingomyelin phosphodiesterase